MIAELQLFIEADDPLIIGEERREGEKFVDCITGALQFQRNTIEREKYIHQRLKRDAC